MSKIKILIITNNKTNLNNKMNNKIFKLKNKILIINLLNKIIFSHNNQNNLTINKMIIINNSQLNKKWNKIVIKKY